MKIIIKKHRDGSFFFSLDANNGNQIMEAKTHYNRKPKKLVNKLAGLLGAVVIDETKR